MLTPLPELVAAYLRQYRTRADDDFWAFDEVAARVTYGTDEEDAWRVTAALIAGADEETLGYVGAGPLEDLVRRFGTDMIVRIESTARKDEKFQACLGAIWLREGEVPPEILKRIVQASGNRIRPLPKRNKA